MVRIVTFFEKVLLTIGIVLALLGFFMINTLYEAHNNYLSYDMLHVVFIWMILLFLVVIAAISENQREESRLIEQELHKETKLMKEVVKDQLLEIKLLREDLSELRKIDHFLNGKKKNK